MSRRCQQRKWASHSHTSSTSGRASAGSCAERQQAVKRKLLKSIAFEDLGARVDAPGVPHDQLPVLSLQERSSDLTRPDDEVPQAIKLLNDDVHLRIPRRTCIPASTYFATVLRFTSRSSDLDHKFRNATGARSRTTIAIVNRASGERSCELLVRPFGVAASIKTSRRRSTVRA